MVLIGHIVVLWGWEYGFIVSAIGGVIGTAIIMIFVSDTPESKGLPSVQELAGEAPLKTDEENIRTLHKAVVKHPGIWIIALSSAFIYITQYALSNWGILFLQKAKDFSLTEAAWVIGFAEAFGIAGTVCAGWLSDKVFKGNRIKPVIISGIVCILALITFLFTQGGAILNIIYIGVFSLSIGMLYCIVAGLMALDIVPRKATGAALSVVGISSYIAVGFQDIVSGYLIQGGASAATSGYDFMPVAIFWLVSAVIAVLLPVVCWKKLQKPLNIK